MFYRKYRPQKFNQLFGLEQVSSALQKSLSQKEIPHAFLFFGPRGVGKTTTARIVAKYVNCQDPQKGEPCGECRFCRAIQEGSFLDLLEIDGASNRGIEDARALKERAFLAPAQGKYKVYIIDEVHMMTKDAFNALLKLLEEPPKHCLFILCTTERQKIPATVVSRCQVFSLRRATSQAIIAKLRFITQQEGADVSNDDLRLIAQEAEGGFRDAENMLEQVIKGKAKVGDLLGGLSDSQLREFLRCFGNKDAKGMILKINDFFDQGVDLERFAKELLKYLRWLMYFQWKAQKELFAGSAETAKFLQELSAKVSKADLRLALSVFSPLSGKINKSPFPPMLLELAVLDYCLGKSGAFGDRSSRAVHAPSPGSQQSGVSAQVSVTSSSPQRNASPVRSVPALSKGKFSWESFLTKVKPFNHSLEALLRSCRLRERSEERILIEAFYPFHKERLEASASKRILYQVLREGFDFQGELNFVLGNKERASANDEVASAIGTGASSLPTATLAEEELIHLEGGEEDVAGDANEIFTGDL